MSTDEPSKTEECQSRLTVGLGWLCYQIVMAWPWQIPSWKWCMWMLSHAGQYATYPCEDCIGMKEHGCYCKNMNAVRPGGPAA